MKERRIQTAEILCVGTELLIGDIVNSTTQITEGISSGMGIDIKSLLLGALGGKVMASNDQN